MPEIKLDNGDSVLTGKDAKKNQSGLAKIGQALITDDLDKVGETLLYDNLLPAVKNTITNFLKAFIDQLFYGESKGNYGSTAAQYHSAGSGGGNPSNRSKNQFHEAGDSFIFTSPEITSRGDGEATLYRLGQILDGWGYVNVANLYSLCNETAPYTYNGYGWRSLQGASVGMAPGGQYCIKLPRPILLKQ